MRKPWLPLLAILLISTLQTSFLGAQENEFTQIIGSDHDTSNDLYLRIYGNGSDQFENQGLKVVIADFVEETEKSFIANFKGNGTGLVIRDFTYDLIQFGNFNGETSSDLSTFPVHNYAGDVFSLPETPFNETWNVRTKLVEDKIVYRGYMIQENVTKYNYTSYSFTEGSFSEFTYVEFDRGTISLPEGWSFTNTQSVSFPKTIGDTVTTTITHNLVATGQTAKYSQILTYNVTDQSYNLTTYDDLYSCETGYTCLHYATGGPAFANLQFADYADNKNNMTAFYRDFEGVNFQIPDSQSVLNYIVRAPSANEFVVISQGYTVDGNFDLETYNATLTYITFNDDGTSDIEQVVLSFTFNLDWTMVYISPSADFTSVTVYVFQDTGFVTQTQTTGLNEETTETSDTSSESSTTSTSSSETSQTSDDTSSTSDTVTSDATDSDTNSEESTIVDTGTEDANGFGFLVTLVAIPIVLLRKRK